MKFILLLTCILLSSCSTIPQDKGAYNPNLVTIDDKLLTQPEMVIVLPGQTVRLESKVVPLRKQVAAPKLHDKNNQFDPERNKLRGN